MAVEFPDGDRSDSAADAEFDPDAEFFSLWSKHHSTVFAYIVSLVQDSDSAADVLQETAAVLWRKRRRYDRKTRFTTWACGVARLEAFRFLRERKKSSLQFSDEALRCVAERFEEQLEDEPTLVEDRRRALHVCLQTLTGQQRELLQARYIEGVSTSDVAKRFDVSLDSLYAKLKRIRAKMASCIEHRLRQQQHRGFGDA